MRFLIGLTLAFVFLAVDNAKADFLTLKFIEDDIPANVMASFIKAKESINSLITTRYPDARVPMDVSLADSCGSPYINGKISQGTILNRLTIYVSVRDIDGPSGVLATAGPCGLWVKLHDFLLPLVGIMIFDKPDTQSLVAANGFEDVVLHEMLHCMGFGTASQWNDLVKARPILNDPLYTGIFGKEGYYDVGGPSQTFVPLANTGGKGTALSHWREFTFRDELMTGYKNGTSQSLSLLTAKALIDIGYHIDLSSPIIDLTYHMKNNHAFKVRPAVQFDLEGDTLVWGVENKVDVSSWIVDKTNLRSLKA
jgi:hypothetical protein